MAKEFLSICIPTRNRSHLLADLLTSIANEIFRTNVGPDLVKVYVSDNASTDATRETTLRIMGTLPHLIYSCNEINIGGDRNILACYQKSCGSYRWIIGDDEILTQGALKHIVEVLQKHKPSWFINNGGDPEYGKGLGAPKFFVNVKDFIHDCVLSAPEALMVAGTISANIFKEECFDIELALREVSGSIYSQYFALLHGLKLQGGSVFYTNVHTLIFREQRPVPSGGKLPPDSDGNWEKCMSWLKTEFDLPELDTRLQSKLVSRALFNSATKHPFKTLWNHRAFLLIPAAYPRMIRRIYWCFRN